MNLRIVALSDIHGYLPNITEEADIMILAGDIVPLSIQFDLVESKEWFKTIFANWINYLPVKKVYMIAGNHDFFLEKTELQDLAFLFEVCNYKLIYLRNSWVIHRHEGKEIKIFGTPYCKIFGNWPFMRTNEILEEKFKEIPDKVDIIIAHDPPFAYGDADIIMAPTNPSFGRHLGNHPLAKRLFTVDYKILFCGHIHTGDHIFNEEYKIVNVSYLNEQYKPHYPPFYTSLNID